MLLYYSEILILTNHVLLTVHRSHIMYQPNTFSGANFLRANPAIFIVTHASRYTELLQVLQQISDILLII